MLKKWEVARPVGVVIIVHGKGEHIGRYEWLIQKWNEKNYHVIGGDLCGFGRHPGKKGHIRSFQQYVDQVVSWYEAAKQYKLPVFLLGHSFGGLVVIVTMLEKHLNVHGVILSSPCLKLKNLPPLPKVLGAKLIHRFVPGFMADSQISKQPATRNVEIREKFRRDPLRVTKVSVRWYIELEKAMKRSFKEAKQFPNVPLLLMQAGEDGIIDKEGVKQWYHLLSIETKIYKEWPHLYHELFNEPEQEEVFHYAEKFVSLYR